jgi:hypothetical protein
VSRKNYEKITPQHTRHAKEYVRRKSFNYVVPETFGVKRRLVGIPASALAMAVRTLQQEKLLPQPDKLDIANEFSIKLMPLSFIGRQANSGIVSHHDVSRARYYFEAQSQDRTSPIEADIARVSIGYGKHLHLVLNSPELDEERQRDANVLEQRFGFKGLRQAVTAKPIRVQLAGCKKSVRFDFADSLFNSEQILSVLDEFHPINEPLAIGKLDIYPAEIVMAG